MKNLTSTLYLFVALLMGSSLFAQNEGVSIKTSGGAPDASAMLDVVHASKGILIPRVNLANTNSATPVSSPADGLLVFNLTSTVSTGRGFHYWDSPTSSWMKLSTGSSLWTLIGATSHIHYTNGNVRIGPSSSVSPTYNLEVVGASASSDTYTARFDGKQGQLKFGLLDATSQPSIGVASYITQTSKIPAGGSYYSMIFSQVHGDGFKGLELITWLRSASNTTLNWCNINANKNRLYLTSAEKIVLIPSGGGTAQYEFGLQGNMSVTSDSTLKKNITTMGSVLTNVLLLRPVTYTWKADPANTVIDGLIAQEVALKFPRLVTTSTLNTNPSSETPDTVTLKMLNTTGLVPILIKAIQEQQVIIDGLKTRLHNIDGL